MRDIDAAGSLNPAVDVASGADALWTLNHPSTWHLLVVRRGWADAEYQAWLERAFVTLLLA